MAERSARLPGTGLSQQEDAERVADAMLGYLSITRHVKRESASFSPVGQGRAESPGDRKADLADDQRRPRGDRARHCAP
jgi:hypothetical protein